MIRRTLLAAFALVAAVAGSTALAGTRVGTSAPIFCAGHTTRAVALTFDDGPSGTTPKVIRTLRRFRARATFFVVGRKVAEHASLVRQEAAIGEVGNHSWSHPVLSKDSSSTVFAQLARTQKAVVGAGAPAPIVFRPPYGKSNATVAAEAASLNLEEIRSSVDSFDWRGATKAVIARRVLTQVQPGSIVLMHDVIPRTAAALPEILRALETKGFQIVTVSELLRKDPPPRAQTALGAEGC